jgi:hypothetical protein
MLSKLTELTERPTPTLALNVELDDDLAELFKAAINNVQVQGVILSAQVLRSLARVEAKLDDVRWE